MEHVIQPLQPHYREALYNGSPSLPGVVGELRGGPCVGVWPAQVVGEALNAGPWL